jgi:hypothetical protein
MKLKKRSSPLKLLSQSQPNFAEMILGWPPSKFALCLYSSNLGTFWLKIEQFWPFEEISIFSNGSHLEWRAGLSDNFSFSRFIPIMQIWHILIKDHI